MLVNIAIRIPINALLAQTVEDRAVMFKKLLLATLIVIIGLWGAGYDVTAVKDDLQHLATENAQTASGQNALDRSDWGPGAD